ncbi:cell surface protein SprA [Lutimonas saemankumensis]|uniref:T9SS outer membrane translocon Sov/SprA n=1 Tax=Lutimonas saemankumensis TaxID=483016 RepID=UPI001CD43015|nr:cell surface protein SprA [Lutimonas saemankumensis]MCA0933563.1 cell surface protein SprA [Lutimonas saemankumensis]
MSRVKRFKYNLPIILIVLLFSTAYVSAQINSDNNSVTNTQPTTSTSRDTISPLPYSFNSNQSGRLFLNDNKELETIYDPQTGNYILMEKIGDYYVKYPTQMTPEEYKDYRLQRDMLEYSKEKLNAIGGKTKEASDVQKNLLPTYYVNSNFFESVFGGNQIDVNVQGSILIKMGLIYQKVENPQLSENNRQSTTFDFDQEINASLNARIGTRLRVMANFDTQSTFNFQNMVKLEYTPTEDDIIRKIEVGNVSMPIRNSLVTGAQNLFGAKMELQFGKTTVTGIFSQQRSQTRSVSAQGGAILNEFDFKASNYDNNRHFFISHAFRDKYNKALENFPLINSSINITRIEIWVTNRNATTTGTRNIVALADLGENNPDNIGPANVIPNPGGQDPSNEANNLEDLLTLNGPIREISTVGQALAPYNMSQGRDYTILENAIKLVQGVDFTMNAQLGFITLNRRLVDADVMAVAYEYTDGTEVYRVGEFTDAGVIAPDNLVVKMLRSEIINPTIPMFDLLMKNVYEIPGAFQLQKDGFRLELLYYDDATGEPVNILQNAQTPGVNDRTILNLLKLDRLDQNNNFKPEGDGFFDYVEGITIDSPNGYFIFPTVEPFGEDLDDQLLPEDDVYIFRELYDRTQAEAQNDFQQKDKYSFKGYFKSDSKSGIPLGAFNVPRGSVKVTSGGRELVEGVDYVVDYNIGNVQIINPTLIASDAPIQVDVENNIGFNQQQRRYMGVDVLHVFNEKLAVGGNIINLNERPLTQKAQFGSEPVNNTIIGAYLTYRTEVPKLTKWANALPNIDTDVPSYVSVRSELAYLIPGTPKGIDLEGAATSYIDDFEGAQIPLDIKSPKQWFTSSTPLGQSGDLDFTNGNIAPGLPDELRTGAKRSKLAWYSIDQIFYGSSLRPPNIDSEELSRAEVRQVNYSELFPQVDLDVTQSSIIRTFDMAYYPEERGTNNYDDSFGSDGKYINPEDRWAGVTRALTTTNFQQANIEYVQFWLMDPYENYSIKPEEGGPIAPPGLQDQVGELYFNFGNISEDILKDDRKMFENGLPEDGIQIPGSNIESTPWSSIPTEQSLLYAFPESDEARLNQDLGLDGINDEDESTKYGTVFGEDPSADNFHYFRGSDFDAEDASILTRYKDFSLTEGNSPTINNSPENYPTSSTTFPDVEDINRDQTMNAIESYYQYKVSLNKTDLVVGQNYIVDSRVTTVQLPNNTTQTTTWYQFRIPITTPEDPSNIINDMAGFTSIRFMRMFLTKFKVPVVLRFGELQLVRGDWRRYTKTLDDNIVPPQEISPEENQKFEVGVVNIEENEDRQPIPYVLPPGIKRERLQGTTTIQQQNEQSVSMKVDDLQPGDTRTIFKNTTFDLRMYKQLKMFIHAEGKVGQLEVKDNELLGIIRLGSDTDDNYYQVEIPLKITDFNAVTPEEIWPVENNLDAAIKDFGNLKLERLEIGAPAGELYPKPVAGEDPEFRIRVKGNPNLSNIRTIMLGVKNVAISPKSMELWFNELRVADFDNKSSWAAIVNADANLADFADVSVTGSASTIGFGSLDQMVNERSQDEMKQYGFVSNINIGQLLPKRANVSIPINFSFGEEFRDPKYDPRFKDVLFQNGSTDADLARDYTQRKSINFINVRRNRTSQSGKPHFYDVENFSVSYLFNETYHRDYNIQKFIDQKLRASANYTYSFEPKVIEPFKSWGLVSDKAYLKFIKDFNLSLLPTSFAINSNIVRSYSEQLSRSLVEGLPDLPVLKQRNFMFDWDYLIAYNLSKSLQFSLRALNNYAYDQFGDNEDLQIYDQFFRIGRPEHYHQTFNLTYKIPFDKFPVLDFINGTYNYTADYDWQAPAYTTIDQVGNTIQNANTHNFTADMGMDRLYNYLGFTKLFTKRKTVDVKQDPETGQQLKAKKGLSTGQKIGKVGIDILTSVKNIRLSYTENNGTFLPGYIPEFGLLGQSNYNGTFAPTFGFVFGSQADILDKAIRNGWLISRGQGDNFYARNYSRSHYDKFDYSANVKFTRDLDIELFGNRTFTESFNQQLDVINGVLDNTPKNGIGNFSISHMMLGSSFKDEAEVFQQFKDNRKIISQRLADETGGNIDGFGDTSQDVVLPAFLAAYSGRSAESVKLSAFRSTPIPNWRISYKGLMSIPWVKTNFRSFTLEHSYRSVYSILSFTNNLKYDEDNPYEDSNRDIAGNYNPQKLYNGVNLIEEFSPLIRVDFKLKNSLSLRAAFNKDKALNLNFNNNTVTEVSGEELVLGMGYRIQNVKMKFKTGSGGGSTTFQGDINLKLDLGIRDNLTIVRPYGIEDEITNNQITGGQSLVSFKFLADYSLNKNLLASFFFDYNNSKFAISTTYPRTSINGGISVRYIIGN